MTYIIALGGLVLLLRWAGVSDGEIGRVELDRIGMTDAQLLRYAERLYGLYQDV